MSEVNRRLMMLKPMRAGVSGYARLQRERGRVLAQLHLRGLTVERVRAFWYLGGGEAVLLGTAPVNPRGEASMTSDWPEERLAPERIRALLVIGDGRRPEALMIGMYARQDAGHLLDAKNAALALCERLRTETEAEAGREDEVPSSHVESGQKIREAGAPSAVRQTSARAEERHVQNGLPQVQCANILPLVSPVAAIPDAQANQPEQPAVSPPPVAAHAADTHAQSELPQAQRASNHPLPVFPATASPAGQALPIEQPAVSPPPVAAHAADTHALSELPQAQRASNPLPVSPADDSPVGQKPSAAPASPPLPREVFLTAIEPMRPAPAPVSARASAPPADRLRPLRWPKGFEQVSAFFRDAPRFALFPPPGWRFVYAGHSGGPDGLWVGYWQADGRVRQLAYAVRCDHPPAEAYRPARGLDGCTYQVLWQRV